MNKNLQNKLNLIKKINKNITLKTQRTKNNFIQSKSVQSKIIQHKHNNSKPIQKKKSLKIINLILYCPGNKYYDEMKKMQTIYLEYFKLKNKDFSYYFYYYDPSIDKNYEITENVIKIKGKETYIPGILNKTIKAFEIVNKHFTYDYLIRTNISSVINFRILLNFLSINNPDSCGKIWNLNIQNCKFREYWGKYFYSGTCLIYKKNVITFIINNKNKLDKRLIDDVSIGVLIYRQNFKNINFNNVLFLKNSYKDGIITYRNKSNNRQLDINRIKFIINKLMI
jgi:hypothetical protein